MEQSISTDKLDKSVYEFLFIDESDYYDKINNLYKYLDLISLTDNILKNPIMEKLIEFPSKSDKYFLRKYHIISKI